VGEGLCEKSQDSHGVGGEESSQGRLDTRCAPGSAHGATRPPQGLLHPKSMKIGTTFRVGNAQVPTADPNYCILARKHSSAFSTNECAARSSTALQPRQHSKLATPMSEKSKPPIAKPTAPSSKSSNSSLFELLQHLRAKSSDSVIKHLPPQRTFSFQYNVHVFETHW
jgi:hypothetical protein